MSQTKNYIPLSKELEERIREDREDVYKRQVRILSQKLPSCKKKACKKKVGRKIRLMLCSRSSYVAEKASAE